MSKAQDSKAASVQQSDAESEKPGSNQDTGDAILIPVSVLETHGQSALVEYERDGIRYRSYVDPDDLQDGGCPAERLQDAPYGIGWEFDFADLGRDAEIALKKAEIWTYEDLQEKDRAIIRIATDLLGRAIWQAAKRSCKTSES